jgi:flavin reductase (DIM6/NTAB) family NADH-FMN oxidoreductase RutF
MSIDQATFRSILGRFASGVTVITAREGDEDFGMTVSAFCSLSLKPPLTVMCVEHTARMHQVLERVPQYAVNILASSQEAISRRFAEQPDEGRFEGLGFIRGTTGAPILNDVLAYLECEVVETFPGGDHTIVVGAVIGGWAGSDKPLLYYRGGYAQLER